MLLTVTLSFAQKKGKMKVKKLAKLPYSLRESSGLTFDANGNLWTHNDSGDSSYIYCIDLTGRIKRSVFIKNGHNNFGVKKNDLSDWEDIAQDQKGNIYIGDIGDNRLIHNQHYIYKIHSNSLKRDTVMATVLVFHYQNYAKHDAEAIFHKGDSLFIMTKSRTIPYDGMVHLYAIPDHITSSKEARLVDSFYIGGAGKNKYRWWGTGVDINKNGNRVVLVGYKFIWLFTEFEGNTIFNGKITRYTFKRKKQREAVVFEDENTLLITDELLKGVIGQKLYRIHLK